MEEIEYYESGKIKYKLTEKENRTNEEYYLESGILAKEKNIIYDEAGIIEKKEREYYNTGQVKSEHTNYFDKINGKEETIEKYYKSGILKSIEEKIKDKFIRKEFSTSGKLEVEERYSKDGVHVYGLIKEYYENGNIKSEISTKDALYEGKHRLYHENGNLAYEETYSSGLRLHDEKYYKENGKLDKIQMFTIEVYKFLGKLIPSIQKQKENGEFVREIYSYGAKPGEVFDKIEEKKLKHEYNKNENEINVWEKKLEMDRSNSLGLSR